MNKTEEEVLESLEWATSNDEVIEAVEKLNGKEKTPESKVLVAAAANLLAEKIASTTRIEVEK